MTGTLFYGSWVATFAVDQAFAFALAWVDPSAVAWVVASAVEWTIASSVGLLCMLYGLVLQCLLLKCLLWLVLQLDWYQLMCVYLLCERGSRTKCGADGLLE